MNSCMKQHGNFCSIDKPFYSVSSSKSCIIKIFQNDVTEIEKRCSISVENNLIDPNAVNLKEGKWLITSSELLEINMKCGQIT